MVLPGGIPCIACGLNQDGRRYFVPDWATLGESAAGLCGDRRPEHIKQHIDKNYAGHLLRIRSGVSELFGAWKDQTVYIVGSGPSLIQNGHLIEKGPGRKVIAINAALRFMVERGQLPDYWFILDWKGSEGWLEGVNTRGISLITSVTTPPEMVDKFENHYHFVGITKSEGNREGVNEKLAYLGGLDAGLTATYSAMYLAFVSGAKRIVFVGQDFAYTFGMYHWDQPTPTGQYTAARAYPSESIAGCDTVTDYQMAVNMTLIHAAAMWITEAGVEVVNASEHGILAWNPRDLADVLAEDVAVKEPAHVRVD